MTPCRSSLFKIPILPSVGEPLSRLQHIRVDIFGSCSRKPGVSRCLPSSWPLSSRSSSIKLTLLGATRASGSGKDQQASDLSGTQRQGSHEVEAALAAQLGPIRGDWLQEIGKRRTQAEAQGSPCLYVKRHIRQFEEISHQGSVVVYGDVSNGASIRAGGDIIVLGRLMGKVYAGLKGDRKAVVFALAMEPKSIAIADELVSGPDGEAQPYPEVAFITAAGAISIEPPMGRDRGAFAEANLGGKGSFDMALPDMQGVKWTTEGLGKNSSRLHSKKPARLAMFTGLYISLAGLAAICAPRTIFGLLFDVRTMTRGWIRVLGVLALVFGIYYIGTAQGELAGMEARGFYLSTVVGRVILFFAFCGLVASGNVQISLLALGLVNLFGALSMLWALRAEDST